MGQLPIIQLSQSAMSAIRKLGVLILVHVLSGNAAYSQVWSSAVALPGSYTSDIAFLSDGSLIFDTDKIYISQDSLRSYSVYIDESADDFWVDGELLYWAEWFDGIKRRNTDGSTTHLLPGITIENIWAYNNVVVAGGAAGQIFRSTDGGASWETANPDFLYRDDSDIEGYVETAAGVVYTQDGYPARLVALQLGNWIHVSTLDPEDLQLDESSGAFVVASDQEILRSDQGLFWESVTTVPSGYSSIRTFDKLSNVIVAVAGDNTYMSNDSGLSWTEITDNLLDPYVDIIRIGPDKHIYAVSDNVIQRSLNPVAATSGVPVEDDQDVPTETMLHGVFPNPTAGKVTLDVVSASSEPAQFTVINALGQIVYKEILDSVRVGSFRHQLSLPLLPSGTYFVSYTGAGGSDTKPFTVVR